MRWQIILVLPEGIFHQISHCQLKCGQNKNVIMFNQFRGCVLTRCHWVFVKMKDEYTHVKTCQLFGPTKELQSELHRRWIVSRSLIVWLCLKVARSTFQTKICLSDLDYALSNDLLIDFLTYFKKLSTFGWEKFQQNTINGNIYRNPYLPQWQHPCH